MALRYVDPAADVGGNGTTLGLTGANAAYVSLNVWEAARQGTLSEPEEVQCAGSSADTTAVAIDGWTTSAANYILITSHVTSRHAGVWNSGIYRLETAASGDFFFYTQENYTRIYALQVSIGHGYAEAVSGDVTLAGIGGLRIERNIVRATIASDAVGIMATHSNTSAVAQNVTANNLVYGFSGTTSGLGIYARSAADRHLCYNNTVYNCRVGLRVRDTQTQIKNNLVIGCTDDYLLTDAAESGSVNNGYDEGTDPAASGIDLSAYSDAAIFRNAGGGDFHLAASSPAKAVGVDLTSDTNFPITEDIDGETRGTSWDIGVDQATGFVSVDNFSSGSVTGSTTLTFAHTVAGSNRMLTVGVTTGGSDIRITGVTYNGVAMTERYDAQTPDPAFAGMAYYTLVAPDTGTHDVVVTAASSANILAAAISFIEVNQSTPVDAHVVATGDDGLPANAVTSALKDMVVDFVGLNGVVSTGRAGERQFECAELSNATETSSLLASTRTGLAGSTPMTWTQNTGGGAWSSIAFNVNYVSAAFLRVQSATNSDTEWFGLSGTVTLGVSATIGNLVVVCIRDFDETVTIDSISDTGGNTWAQATSVAGGDGRLAIWYAVVATGFTVITIGSSDNGFGWRATAMEFSGNVTASVLDAANSASTASGTSHDSGNVTTSTANGLLVGIANAGDGTSMTLDADFTDDPTATDSGECIGYKILSSTGTHSFTGTSNGAATGGSAIAAFKGVSAGGTDIPVAALTLVGRGLGMGFTINMPDEL